MSLGALNESIPPLDADAMALAVTRQDTLTKPPGSLGRLESLGIQLAGIAGVCPPPIPVAKAHLVFAGDHGVVAQGVNAYPQAVTRQMVLNFLAGGAAVNVLARQAGAVVRVIDAGVAGAEFEPQPGLVRGKIAPGTADFAVGPAMTRGQAEGCVSLGYHVAVDAVDDGAQLLACGDMGIGNTTSAAAITAVMTGRTAREVTGPGTGLTSAGVEHKIKVVAAALKLHRPDPADPLSVLCAVGGFEIGAIAGAMLAAAERRVPVVVDGFIATAGALLACAFAPHLAGRLIGGHRSKEPGHDAALAHLGLEPLLDLGMRLGEGTGAVLAFSLVEAAARILTEMATFEQAGVADRES